MARRSKPMEQLTQLTAQELYELAKQKEQEELEAEREALRGRVEELKERRREIIAQYKKDISAIDRDIRAAGGKVRGRGPARARGNLTDKVLELIGRAGTISTKDLKAQLEREGMDTTNMGQTLAYLKRNGRVSAPSRATYTLA